MAPRKKIKRFQSAAGKGDLGIVDYLIELTPDQDQRQQMIHVDNDYAFQSAARNGNSEIVDYLIELTPDQDQRQQMIHVDNDSAFQLAVKNKHPETIVFLAVLFGIEEIPENFRGEVNLNEEKITKLTELKNLLEEKFTELNKEIEPQDYLPEHAANSVIATLLTGKNLSKINKSVQDLHLISKDGLSSGKIILPDELQNTIHNFAFGLEFSGLSKQQQKLANQEIWDFLKPKTKIKAKNADQESNFEEQKNNVEIDPDEEMYAKEQKQKGVFNQYSESDKKPNSNPQNPEIGELKKSAETGRK